MKIVLHAGAWKTGSSAIQVFLKKNAKRLAPRGVLLPPMVRQQHGHQIFFERLTSADDAAAQPCLDELSAMAAETPDGVAIVTSEHYWPLRPEALERVARRLRGVSEELDVLLYVRPQDDMWSSIYAQEAKYFRVSRAAARWGNDDYVHAAIADRALYYSVALEGFRAAFGDEAVKVRAYRRDLFHGGDVVRDFLQFIGVEDQTKLRFVAFDRNPSLGWKAVAMSRWFADEALPLIRAANQDPADALRGAFAFSYAQTRLKFGDKDWQGNSPVVFDEAERREIRAHYAADNQALFDRYFEGRDVFGDVKTTPRSPLDENEIPEAEFAYARRRLLLHLRRRGLALAGAERVLVPSGLTRAALSLWEASPLSYLDRQAKRPRLEE